MTPEDIEKRDKADVRHLIEQEQFRRFLWRVIQSARIFDRTTDGSQGDTSYGRRNLGLEILEMVEQGQPVQHPQGQPILTVLQTLREEAIQQPGEKRDDPKSKRTPYDRTAELDEPDD